MKTMMFDQKTITAAAELIRQGEVVAFPTETVYGLGADATNPRAIQKVYEAKGRPSDNPLIVHVTSAADLKPYVANLSEKTQKLITTFWPGPLTLILEIKENSLPKDARGGLSTVAFRMPDHQLALSLIAEAGVPLVGPSANTSGRPSPTTAEHVYHDLAGKIAGILDAGPTEVGLESTVVDMTGKIPIILRPGMITQEQIVKVVGEVAVDQHILNEEEAPKSPGMKYQHYAPVTEVRLIDWQKNNWDEALAWAQSQNLKIALLANQTIIEKYQKNITGSFALSQSGNIIEASKALFRGLRQLDELSPRVDLILAETYDKQGLALAYMNRLEKAANQKYFR